MTASPPTQGWWDRYQRPARAAYLAILLLATLSPFKADPAPERVATRLRQAMQPSIGRRDVVDGVRNEVLFAGWGVVWTITAAGRVGQIAAAATFTGLGVSALVETAQLFSSNRNTSLLDVATNTTGALGGAVVLLALVAMAGRRRGARSFVGIPALLFAGSYAIAAWLEAVVPLFRQDPVPGAHGWPLTRFAASAAAFRWSSVLEFNWSDLLIFPAAGMLAVAALVEHGLPYGTAFRRVAIGGAGLSVLAELLHGSLGQPMLVGAVLVHAAAVALGAWAAARSLPGLTVALRGQMRPQGLFVAYAAVLAAWALRPYLPDIYPADIQAKLALPWYVPLAALGGRMDFFSVVDVCTPFFLYLPLGGLLAVWPWRKQGKLAGPLPALWLALALEAGQLFVLDRSLDITDVLIQASGAFIGWAMVRRAGFTVYGEVFPQRAKPAPSASSPR
jgi:VanZ family protein